MLAGIERGLDAILFFDLSDEIATARIHQRAVEGAARTTRPRRSRAPGDLPRADRADRRALPGDRQARPAARRPVDRRGGRRDRRGARAARRGRQHDHPQERRRDRPDRPCRHARGRDDLPCGRADRAGHHDGRARPDRRRVHPRERRCPTSQGYKGYPRAICISTNDVVVHGIPDGTVVEDGDLVTIDVGVTLGTAIADSAYTFGVGSIDAESQRLLDVCQDALVAGSRRRGSATGSGTSRTRCRRSSRAQGSRWSRASSGTGSAGTTTRIPTCRTSATWPRPAPLGGDDDRDRADDHDGRSRGLARGGRVDDLDHRRVASAHFEHTVAILPDGPRILTPRVGIATERARLLQ